MSQVTNPVSYRMLHLSDFPDLIQTGTPLYTDILDPVTQLPGGIDFTVSVPVDVTNESSGFIFRPPKNPPLQWVLLAARLLLKTTTKVSIVKLTSLVVDGKNIVGAEFDTAANPAPGSMIDVFGQNLLGDVRFPNLDLSYGIPVTDNIQCNVVFSTSGSIVGSQFVYDQQAFFWVAETVGSRQFPFTRPDPSRRNG